MWTLNSVRLLRHIVGMQRMIPELCQKARSVLARFRRFQQRRYFRLWFLIAGVVVTAVLLGILCGTRFIVVVNIEVQTRV